MKNIKNLISATIFTLTICAVPFVAKADSEMMAKMTPEMRIKMADHHQKMADCLRSSKTMEVCHEEMMKDCEAMGKTGCGMMGEHHKNK